MNDFVEAAKSGEDDSSEERYEKVKKEEAGTADEDPAKQRYQEIKEKAKEELMKQSDGSEEQEEGELEGYDEDELLEDENDEDGEESFITY